MIPSAMACRELTGDSKLSTGLRFFFSVLAESLVTGSVDNIRSTFLTECADAVLGLLNMVANQFMRIHDQYSMLTWQK